MARVAVTALKIVHFRLLLVFPLRLVACVPAVGVLSIICRIPDGKLVCSQSSAVGHAHDGPDAQAESACTTRARQCRNSLLQGHPLSERQPAQQKMVHPPLHNIWQHCLWQGCMLEGAGGGNERTPMRGRRHPKLLPALLQSRGLITSAPGLQPCTLSCNGFILNCIHACMLYSATSDWCPHTDTCTNTHTCKYSRACTHTRMHTHLTHMYAAPPHTHTHTHLTRTHVHTHAHMHTRTIRTPRAKQAVLLLPCRLLRVCAAEHCFAAATTSHLGELCKGRAGGRRQVGDTREPRDVPWAGRCPGCSRMPCHARRAWPTLSCRMCSACRCSALMHYW